MEVWGIAHRIILHILSTTGKGLTYFPAPFLTFGVCFPTHDYIMSVRKALHDYKMFHGSSHCVNLFQLPKVKMNGTLLCQDKSVRGCVHPLLGYCSFLSTTQVVILWGHKTGSFNQNKVMHFTARTALAQREGR